MAKRDVDGYAVVFCASYCHTTCHTAFGPV
nr:MAG TPA: hypothetical protein [Caudoviricetes sp.]